MIRFIFILSVALLSSCTHEDETYYNGATRTLYIDSIGFPDLRYSIVEVYCEGDDKGWTGIGSDIPYRALKLDSIIDSTKCADFIVSVSVQDEVGHFHNYREIISKNNNESTVELTLTYE